MGKLRIIYVVYALIAILCIVPEVIGFIDLADHDFESGPRYSAVYTRFKINMGFILFGLFIQIAVVSSLIAAKTATQDSD